MNRYIVVLAAGNSTRFGGIKQLAKIGNEYLINRIFQQVKSVAGTSSLIMLGANAKQIEQRLDNDAERIWVSDWEEGPSASISAAVNRLKERASHIMFILADQVGLTTKCLDDCWRMSDANPNAIVCAIEGNYEGPPVIFPKVYFEDLIALDGDVGAKAIIQKNKNNLVHVYLPDASVDIDTQHDLEAWKKLQDQ